jgi:hypothetical protein
VLIHENASFFGRYSDCLKVPYPIVKKLNNLNGFTLIFFFDFITRHLKNSDSHGVVLSFGSNLDGSEHIKPWMEFATS